MKTFWVYMLCCADGSFYVGVTSNLEQRVVQRERGDFEYCYTSSRRPVRLVYSQEFSDATDAIAAEKQLKGWSWAKKRALVEGDWLGIARLARSGGGYR
ncbi:GIY-YIG nuclease family protein [Vulcanimicrobium alpinum]|uniref:GIY-YIG nuclease family protein n=1 Tax=Vulcanimicrobium alpinum TaxID=3016050 RepID=UPI00295E5366|nr:GIY-YIG nuclease family protein [Vulcanimicrobium alpinum]